MAGVYSKTEENNVDPPSMTCCLGNHPLDEPRLLPCQHSFCTNCIKEKVGDTRTDFVCPKCQLTIPLTKKEVDKLQEDVLYHIIQETKQRTECVTCGFDGKNTPGTFQCLDCADVMCGDCKTIHTKTSLTRFHRVVSIQDIQAGKYKRDIQTEKQLLCDIHSKPNKPRELELYCEECTCLVCYMCIHEGHKGHDCKHVEKINEDKTLTVTNHVTELLDMKTCIGEFADVLKQQQGENKELEEQLENEVYNRAAKFIEIIEKVKEDTLKYVKNHFEKEDTTLHSKLMEAENKMIRIDSIVNYTKAFLKHSGKVQFLQHENEMMKKLTEQKQQNMETTLKTNILELGQPQYGKTEEFLKETFGKITTTTKTLASTKHREVHRVLMKEPEILFHENTNNCVYDITVAENDDIVAVVGSSLQVYNSDGQYKETIECSDELDPWNMLAKADTLYVSGYNDEKVLVMDFKGNVKKTITLPQTNQGYDNKGLAVDDEGNVYISSSSTHTIYECRLNKTNAKVFIQQGTHPDLYRPMYLGVTSGGEVIVSNDSSNTIQVYNRQGVLLWQYKGQGDMMLSNPRGVFCDSQGFIYIADCDNHRIQIIKDATFQGCIKLKDFNTPYCITLDKDDNIVCGNGDYLIVKAKCWV